MLFCSQITQKEITDESKKQLLKTGRNIGSYWNSWNFWWHYYFHWRFCSLVGLLYEFRNRRPVQLIHEFQQ